MASERWNDEKIAIAGALKFKNQFSEPQISWFENSEGIDKAAFDFVLDAGKKDTVAVISGSETILIHNEMTDMLSLLKSLVSLLTDGKLLDVDFADIKTICGNECSFKSLCVPEASAVGSIEAWVKENLKECGKSLLIHFQKDNLLLMDIDDIAKKITYNVNIAEDNIIVSLSETEFNKNDVKISFWYR